MYKTKLQELCHQKRWSLPCYSSMRDGPDHNPRFKTSVSVNGLSFHSSVSHTSSKQSQNDAAMLAFLHFTSPPPPPSSSVSSQLTSGGTKIEETSQGSEVHSQASDVQFQYKNQLQNYARRKSLDSPVYSSIREGSAHAPCFKATVTIDGLTFDGLEFFTNIKQAEDSAARVALLSLSSDLFQEDESGYYKNLLQQLYQREDLSMPVYKTLKSGASHMPTFLSSVIVEDEEFYGKAGRSKKEAETKAAKVAYTVFTERRQGQSIGLSSRTEENGTPKSTDSDLVVTVDSQNIKEKCELVPSSATTYADDMKVNSAEMVASNAKASSGDSTSSPSIPCMDDSTPMKHPLSILDSSTGRARGTRSYLLCKRVRVYTCFPHTAFPEGITLLPISNDKWVAVSLEFPNESN